MTLHDSPFEWVDGKPFFRNLPVIIQDVKVGGYSYSMASLKDAADLLDDEEFARRFTEEDRAPYGLELWPSAVMLAEYILQMGKGAGRSALEIGCGLGLVSMVAARAEWKIVATDREPIALQCAAYNARQNDITIDEYQTLNWHKPEFERQFEYVFAADVLYQLVDHVPLLKCIQQFLSPRGIALIADPNRSVADRFESLAESNGFSVEVIPVETVLQNHEKKTGRIFRLQRADTPTDS